MTWTKQPPTEPGWYWAKYVNMDFIRPVYIEIGNKRVMGDFWRLNDFELWNINPIQPPELPEGMGE